MAPWPPWHLGSEFQQFFLRLMTRYACSDVATYGALRCVDRHFQTHCRCRPQVFADAARRILGQWQQSVWYRPVVPIYRTVAHRHVRCVPFHDVSRSFYDRMLPDMESWADFQLMASRRHRRCQVLERMRGACRRARATTTQWRGRFYVLAAADAELRVSCPWWYTSRLPRIQPWRV